MVNIKKRLKNKKGFVSIYVIIGLAVLLPFMFFVSIDMPNHMSMNRKIKNTLDNAVSTAITCLDETSVTNGSLVINTQEAEARAKEVIKKSFGLNDDMTVNENSLISDTPTIRFKVINNPNAEPTYSTPNGEYTIKNPSVIIYAEIPVKGLFLYKTEVTIKHTAISQVQFK